MQLKVDLDILRVLSSRLKQTERSLEQQVGEMYSSLKSLLSQVRSDYPEYYVQSAAGHAEGDLREVWDSAVRISDRLSEHSEYLNWSADHYLRTEELLRNLHIQTSFRPPAQAAPVMRNSRFTMGAGKTGPSNRQNLIMASATLLQQLKRLWWRFYEGLLLKNLEQYHQGDARILSFTQMIDKGSPEEQKVARDKLRAILHAFEEIARSQTAYNVYKQFGNERNTLAAFKNAEDQRRILADLGVSQEWYAGNIDLSKHYLPFSLSACQLNPLRDDGSSTLMEFPEMMPVFMLAMINEPYRKWASANVEGLEQQAILIRESLAESQEAQQATIGPIDPYNSVSEEDILYRDDPEVSARLRNTYWFTLTPEEQDRRYAEIREATEKYEKEWGDKERSARTGIGNPFAAKVIDGGTNMVVQAINTASVGLAGQVTELIMGPQPEGTYNPLDNPNGKQAGEVIGNIIGFALPFKLLQAVKTPEALAKLSPTLVRSMVAEGVFSTAGEVSDAISDYKNDGTQSLNERTGKVALNTVTAGAGDTVIRFAAKAVFKGYQSISQQLQELAVPKPPQGSSGKIGTIQPREGSIIPDEVTPNKGKEAGNGKVEGTGNDAKIPQSGPEWEDYFRSKYGDDNVDWKTSSEYKLYGDNHIPYTPKIRPNATITKPSLPNGGKPEGNYAAIKGKDVRGLKRQNEAANVLAENGYRTTMLDEVPNGNGFDGNGYGIDPGKSPDFIIERQVYDCYAPDLGTKLDNVLRTLREKTTKQARRIVLNLNDYPVEKRTELIEFIKSQTKKDLKHLDELLIIEDRQVTRAYWRFE